MKKMAEDIKLTQAEIDYATDHWGWSEEYKKLVVPKFTPFQKRFIKNLKTFFDYKIIMEVVESNHCARRAEPGDKTVFGAIGVFLPEESTFPGGGFCTWSLTTILPFLQLVYDHICAGIDPTPMGQDLVRCPDIEPEKGGTGSVLYRIYCIKEPVHVRSDTYRSNFQKRLD